MGALKTFLSIFKSGPVGTDELFGIDKSELINKKAAPIIEPDPYEGYLDVKDFPELNYKNIRGTIFGNGFLWHKSDFELSEDARVPFLMERRKEHHLIDRKLYGVHGKISILTSALLTKEGNLEGECLTYRAQFDGDGLGYIYTHSGCKDPYPDEYYRPLQITYIDYHHKFDGEFLCFYLKMNVKKAEFTAPNPRELDLKFKVNEAQFVNQLIYEREGAQEIWDALAQRYEREGVDSRI